MGKEDKRKESSGRSSHHDTAARTRPLSFEEIMLRRKKKCMTPDYEPPSGSEKQIVQDDSKISQDKSRPLSGLNKEKVNDRVLKNDDRRKGEGSHVKSKDKANHDSEAHVEEKEKTIYSKNSRDKEKKMEKPKHHHSRDPDKRTTSSVKENEKKQQKHSVASDNRDGPDRKYAGQSKRKEQDYIDARNRDARNREDFDRPKLRRHDVEKVRATEYAERNDRRKEDSRFYHEEPKSKRRRSRSREYERERNRSVSLSPQTHKHASKRRDHEQSSAQPSKEKSRRKYSDGVDKSRPSGNDGYNGGHYRKHGSGLGGYSPRKRRTEAAVKSPSPTARSPDRKTATWDQPPPGSDNSEYAHMFANIQSAVLKVHNVSPSVPVTPAAKISQPVSLEIASLISASVDPVQLTQATRPLRRLYIENLPSSTSDKAVIDCLNNFLMSSGINHIKGTAPCINCMINKEKSQAVVEFLTPEDATAALSFDGRSFSGSILKIRRPKDFVEVATGVVEKTKAEARPVANAVKDSAYKIFVGGVSEAISSEMLMEVVSAFGPLKAFYFEFNDQLAGPCAFFEYVDPSITLKACAGLNGMKLGGKILTAVQAFSDYKVEEENVEISISYDVPSLAKPLLATPTKVLQLKNVLDKEEYQMLSDSELEEILEDIRLECVRFGAVKSLNIIRYNSSSETVTEAPEIHEVHESEALACVDVKMESPISNSRQDGELVSLNNTLESQDVNYAVDNMQINNDNHMMDIRKETPGVNGGTACNETQQDPDFPADQQENSNVGMLSKLESVESELVSKVATLDEAKAKLDVDVILEDKNETESTKEHVDMLEDVNARATSDESITTEVEQTSNANTDDSTESTKSKSQDQSLGFTLFEPGCVLVEFLREDATCIAACSLHGRTFGDKILMAGFFPHELYLARFPR